MADAVELILRVTDQATPTLQAASGATDRLRDSTRKAGESLSESARSTGRAADAHARLADHADSAGRAASKMRGAAQLLSPQLGELAGVVNDGADAVEVLTGTFGLSAAAMGPIAIAVVALGAAYFYLANEAKKAEAAVATSAKAAQAAGDWALRKAAIAKRAADEEMLATGQATKADLELRDRLQEVTALYGPRLEVERKLLEAAQARKAAAANTMDMAGRGYGGDVGALHKSYMAEDAEVRRLTASVKGLEQNQGELLQRVTRGVLMRKDETKVSREVKQAVDEEAEAKRRLAEAERARATGQAASVAAMEEDTQLAHKAATALEQIEEAARNANAAQRSGIETIRAARADELRELESTYQEGVAAAAGRDAELLRLAEEYEAAQAAIRRKYQAQEGAATIGTTSSGGAWIQATTAMASAVGSGSVSAVASQFGPIGQLIGAIIEAIKSIVPEEGEEGLLDKIHREIMDIKGEIGELPGWIQDALFRSISEGHPAISNMIDELVQNLMAEAPEAIGATLSTVLPMVIKTTLHSLMMPQTIADAVSEGLFNEDSWRKVGESIAAAWKDAVGGEDNPNKDFFQANEAGGYGGTSAEDSTWAGRTGTGLLTGGLSEVVSGFINVFDSGTTYVPRDGLYQLHAGEQVVTATGVRTSGQDRNAGGGDARGHARMSAQGGRAFFEIDIDSLSDLFGQLRQRGYAI